MFQQVFTKNGALRSLSVCAMAVMGLILLPAGSAVAEDAPQQEQVAPQTEAAPVVQQDAMRVYKDPQTGKLVAPPRQVREALAAQTDKQRQSLNQSTEGLQARVHRNGMVTMDLQGRFMSHYMVVRGDDGQLEHFCTDGEIHFLEKLVADYNAQKNAQKQEVPSDR